MTKLLVGVGAESGIFSDSIEIIDLESSSSSCQNLPTFPLATLGSFGGLGFDNQPMICDGDKVNKKCFSLEGTKWVYSQSLKTARYLVGISSSPYPSKSQKFFVTGGYDGGYSGGLNTAEVLTEQGWETLPQILPVTIYSHCHVLVNATTVLVIGGAQNGSRPSKSTFYFNTENEVWTKGPELKKERESHSCGRIRRNSNSQELSIIVAGGIVDLNWLSSVEILDPGSNEWRKGPELPFGISDAAMVEDQKGGVLLVGGGAEYANGQYLDTLFQLPHAGEDATWTHMEQKLKSARSQHVAFLVPDSIAKCS
jgi:hypothetical protein